MTPNELIEKLNNDIATLKTQVKAADKSAELEKMNTAHEALKTEISELKIVTPTELNEAIDKIKAINKAQSEEIGKLKIQNEKNPVGYKTMAEALHAAFSAKEVQDEIETIVKNGGKQTHTLSVEVGKVAIVMGEENTIGSGSTLNTLTQNTGLISPIRKRELRYLANVSVGQIGTSRALWIEETDEQGTPIMLAEAAAKTQLSVKYVEQTMAVKKCAVYGKVTTELMADLPQLISYIETNLMKRLDIKLEDELFTGTGVGDELKGIDAYATTFTGSSLAGQVNSANELDVLEAIALQSKVALGEPNACFVHPSTMSAIKLIKDDQGRPVWKDYVTIGGEFKVSGMNIIESMGMTAGSFYGGDLTAVHVLIRSELGIQIGLDGNDFTQNKKTMLVEKRLVQFVSANDTAVLIKGTFAAAKILLEAGA